LHKTGKKQFLAFCEPEGTIDWAGKPAHLLEETTSYTGSQTHASKSPVFSARTKFLFSVAQEAGPLPNRSGRPRRETLPKIIGPASLGKGPGLLQVFLEIQYKYRYLYIYEYLSL
jgi:hypothetical protein